MSRPIPPGPIEHDDDGNPIPIPDASSDALDLFAIMEYGRRKGFQFGGAIRVGKIAIQRVVDLRQHEARRDLGEDPDPGVWAAHGYDGPGE